MREQRLNKIQRPEYAQVICTGDISGGAEDISARIFKIQRRETRGYSHHFSHPKKACELSPVACSSAITCAAGASQEKSAEGGKLV